METAENDAIMRGPIRWRRVTVDLGIRTLALGIVLANLFTRANGLRFWAALAGTVMMLPLLVLRVATVGLMIRRQHRPSV